MGLGVYGSAIDEYPSFGGGGQSSDDVGQGRLPATGWPHQDQKFIFIDAEFYPVEDQQGAEAFRDLYLNLLFS